MRTYTVDITAGGKLSDLIEAQFGDSPKRCAAMALQNLKGTAANAYFGGIGNPSHELLPGQTTILPVGSTRNVEFAPAAINVIVSLFSER